MCDDFTTLMIKNIPCKYNQDWLLADVQAYGVNFLQMPLTRRGDMCMGYAFVNFRTHELAAQFLRDFNGMTWSKRPNSTKRAEVSVANEQGFQANVQKFVQSAKKNTSRVQPFVDYSSQY
jgi:RNA recognition motif-containing protein